MEKVSRFKYAAWNIRRLGEKKEELDKILKENNIKISVITESKKKLQGTKETEHYTTTSYQMQKNVKIPRWHKCTNLHRAAGTYDLRQ